MAFTFEMLLTLSLMIFAIIGYSTRKFPIDAVSISVLGLLFLIFEIYNRRGHASAALSRTRASLRFLRQRFSVVARNERGSELAQKTYSATQVAKLVENCTMSFRSRGSSLPYMPNAIGLAKKRTQDAELEICTGFSRLCRLANKYNMTFE